MYRVRIADKAGFCFGVKRAIKMAERATSKKDKVYTFGPIIHNPQEVKRLKGLGIKVLKNPSVRNATLILRTHGISLEQYEKLLAVKSLNIVDAVCPFVKKAQNIVKELSQQGKAIVIIGEKSHPEIIALLSYGNEKTVVISDKKDIKKIKFNEELNIVSQTTQSLENFNNIVKILSDKYKTKIYNTICKATFDRQAAAYKYAKDSDLMIVIGGKNSANTARLAKLCANITSTRHIEDVKDLKKSWFKNKKNICLTAGASTPDWIIKDIYSNIKKILKEHS
jgi:4-hydroxy-3-methylbut-2-enyl diphosphate reductase